MNIFGRATLILALVAVTCLAPLAAVQSQTIPNEATAADITAGTSSSKFISPRRFILGARAVNAVTNNFTGNFLDLNSSFYTAAGLRYLALQDTRQGAAGIGGFITTDYGTYLDLAFRANDPSNGVSFVGSSPNRNLARVTPAGTIDAKLPPSATQLLHWAPTPPMAICTWQFPSGVNTTESQVSNIVQMMSTNGMQSAGYSEVWISDGWSATNRAADGHLQEDPLHYPSGISNMVQGIKSLGYRKAGIYTALGDSGMDCSGRAGSPPWRIAQDVQQFSDWGIEALYLDYCNGSASAAGTRAGWSAFSAGLMDFVYTWGKSPTTNTMAILASVAYPPPQWAADYVNIIEDYSSAHFPYTIQQAMTSALQAVTNSYLTGPGHYYEVCWTFPEGTTNGVGGQSTNCARAALALNAICYSPIITGSVTNPANLQFMTNAEIIAVDQSWGGSPARVLTTSNQCVVFTRYLGGGTNAFAVASYATTNTTIALNWGPLGLASNQVVTVRDLWARADLGLATNSYTYTAGPTNVAMLTFRPVSDVQSSMQANFYSNAVFNAFGMPLRIGGLDTVENTVAAIYAGAQTGTGNYGFAYDGTHYLFNDPSSIQIRVGNVSVITGDGNNLTNSTGAWKTTGTIQLGGGGGATIRTGTGSPEGSKAGNVGDIYLRTDGSGNTYTKTNGTGNTGWYDNLLRTHG